MAVVALPQGALGTGTVGPIQILRTLAVNDVTKVYVSGIVVFYFLKYFCECNKIIYG